MMLNFRAWLAAALVLVSGGSLVSAQSAESDGGAADREARRLFLEGTDFFERGMFADARERFEDAYGLSGRPELLYNVASCHDRLDERAEAIGFYERFVAALPNSPRAPGVWSRLEVLRRDVAVVDEEPVNQLGGLAAEEPDASGEQTSSAGRLLGPVLSFSVAGAGLVTFAAAGLIASGRYNDAGNECRTVGCDESSLEGAERASLIADVGLGVMAAGAVAGVLWLLLSPADPEEPPVTAVVAPGTVGLQLQGDF